MTSGNDDQHTSGEGVSQGDLGSGKTNEPLKYTHRKGRECTYDSDLDEWFWVEGGNERDPYIPPLEHTCDLPHKFNPAAPGEVAIDLEFKFKPKIIHAHADGRQCLFDHEDQVWMHPPDGATQVVCDRDHSIGEHLNLQEPASTLPSLRPLSEWIDKLRDQNDLNRLMYTLGQFLEAHDAGLVVPDALTPEQETAITAAFASKVDPDPTQDPAGPLEATSHGSALYFDHEDGRHCAWDAGMQDWWYWEDEEAQYDATCDREHGTITKVTLPQEFFDHFGIKNDYAVKGQCKNVFVHPHHYWPREKDGQAMHCTGVIRMHPCAKTEAHGPHKVETVFNQWIGCPGIKAHPQTMIGRQHG